MFIYAYSYTHAYPLIPLPYTHYLLSKQVYHKEKIYLPCYLDIYVTSYTEFIIGLVLHHSCYLLCISYKLPTIIYISMYTYTN